MPDYAKNMGLEKGMKLNLKCENLNPREIFTFLITQNSAVAEFCFIKSILLAIHRKGTTVFIFSINQDSEGTLAEYFSRFLSWLSLSIFDWSIDF